MSAEVTLLNNLLHASSVAARDEAWTRFVTRFSPLLLHTAHAVTRDRDHAMDAYAEVLLQLSAEDYRRLRQYSEESGAQFTTWLVVVARRLCVDHLRQRYGRTPTTDSRTADQVVRRRLEDLIAVEIGERTDIAEPGEGPEETIRQRDLATALADALTHLTPAQRLLLTMRFEDDLPDREIARLLHYPTRFHVHRALTKVLATLRQILTARGVDRAEP